MVTSFTLLIPQWVLGPTKQNGSLSRRDAVIMNRLQIGHTRATHAHLLGTVMTRKQYYFGSTLKDLFNNTSVNDKIAFIKDTHFYTHI